jgi:hypothetical protein
VLAWNAFVLLSFVGAGAATLAWLRELGLVRGPALAGGLAFSIAPYRAAQTAGHLLGPISIFLPLALWAFERGRRGSPFWYVGSGLALSSIPLSGQVHLALGAVPFFVLYALCRTRRRVPVLAAGGAALAAAGAGIAIRYGVISGTLEAGGRSLGEVAFYSAEPLDFVTRHQRHGSESFVFLGWLTPVAALLGLALLVRARRNGLALALGVGALVPILLALGTHLPVYSALWHALPPFRYPRVPERLMPIACLTLAALLAVALGEAARRRAAIVVAVAIAVLFVDLHATTFGRSAADEENAAFAAARRVPGRLLELPVFLPAIHFGSVYLYYDMQARRERPEGYSTLAPLVADVTARELQRLNCGDWTGGRAKLLRTLGVDAVALHEGLYTENPDVPNRIWFAWRALLAHGFRPVAADGAVTLFAEGRGARRPPPVPEPARNLAYFCEGWYPPDGGGRQMSDGHAPLWLYGSRARLVVSAAPALPVRLSVDGRTRLAARIGPLRELGVSLGRRGWHLVSFDAHLPKVGGRPVGVRLVVFARS